MTAEEAVKRRGWAARSELALRHELEAFCRERWPDARVVHELVMGAGRVRADVVAITPTHIAAFEVKGEYDDTTRLLHQVGMYQLCVPEVWMVVPTGHAADARLIRHLIPSVGLLVGTGTSDRHHFEWDGKLFKLAVEDESTPRQVVPEMMLEMLWRDELAAAYNRQPGWPTLKKPTRPQMIKALLALGIEEITKQVCIELRARNALWRADAAIT